jgi:hypothetical protein
MDRVNRCPKCGKRTVPSMGKTGRTELICLWCDKPNPESTELAKLADRPLAKDVPPEAAAEVSLRQKRPGRVIRGGPFS